MARLNKHVAIARSGVYVYSAGALPGLKLSVPPEKKDQQSFGVFRPPEVLIKAKDKFTKLPVTLEHPPRLIDGNNFREYAQGYTGDSVTVEEMKDGHNILLCSTLTLADNESINAYYRGIVEVSPGYIGVFDWQEGTSPDGEHYDIVMQDITEVNHLALTRRGRGGPSACVLDSREVLVTKRKSGLFYAIYKRMRGVQDAAEDSFVSALSSLMAGHRKMSDEEIANRVKDLEVAIDYLPDSAEKLTLADYVADLVNIHEESDEANKQAAVMIGNLYARLDSAAMDSIVADAYDEVGSKQDEASDKKEDEGKKPESEPEPGETAEHEASETKEEEQAEHSEAETASETALDEPQAGPDDSIYVKKYDELTQQEKDFVWCELMEMLKAKTIAEKAPPVEASKPADDSKEAEANAESDEVSEAKPEEKDEKEEKNEEVTTDSALDANTEPRYPDSSNIEPVKPSVGTFGIDMNEFIGSLKRRGGS